MDNNMVIEFMTFKSGKFAFSRKYSAEKTDRLIMEAVILYQTVVDLPILPKFAEQLNKELIRKSIFGTAAIEGNPLSERRVQEIVEKPSHEKSEIMAEKEIANLKSAYELLNTLLESKAELNEEIIKKIHFEVTKEIEHKYNIPGQYRQEKVFVGNEEHGGIYTPPKIKDDIQNLMKEFFLWLKSPEFQNEDLIKRAALAHYHLGLIHPFSDGNGRTARLVEALLLKKANVKYIPIMLSNYYYRNLNDYFWAFSNSINNNGNDITPFIEFVLKGHISCLKEVKETIIFFIRKFTLKDYYRYCRDEKKITRREYDLLKLLLDYPLEFSLSDLFKVSPLSLLYKNSSERTARRDLKKLSEKKLLGVKENKYFLNMHFLD